MLCDYFFLLVHSHSLTLYSVSHKNVLVFMCALVYVYVRELDKISFYALHE